MVLVGTTAIFADLAIGGLFLWLAGYDPLAAYRTLFIGAFGSLNNLAETLLRATPLILIGAGLAIAFRANVWNIGAEGQFYAGAVGCNAAGISLGGLPSGLSIPLVLLTGMLCGAMWALLAGILKVRFGANEIVTTIMLNFIAVIATSYLVTGPMIEEVGMYPQSGQIAEGARLPYILPNTRLHLGLLLALAAAVALHVLLWKTTLGFEIRTVGLNPTVARCAGMRVNRNILWTMALSGAAAGLAGAVEVSGLTHRLYQQISPGYGYDGIAVALLGGNGPLACIFTGLLFGAIRSGSEIMQIKEQVPSVLVYLIQGLIILSAAGLGAFQFSRLRRGS